MQVLRRAAVVAALALPMAATPASAQKYHFDFGVDGGYSWYSKSLGTSDIGGAQIGSIAFKPNWFAGSQLTWWSSPFHFGPRFGIRANFQYTMNALIQHNANASNNSNH